MKIIDFLAFMVLLFMLPTGIFLKFTFPLGRGRYEVWCLSRHAWGNILYYISVLFLMFIFAHLVAHKEFIIKVIIGKTTTDKYYRLITVVMGRTALVFIAFLPVLYPVTEI